MSGATLIAVFVGLVVLAVSFGLVKWSQTEDQGQKGHGQGQKG
jgi:hypothetical protein